MITFRDVHKQFGSIAALRAIDLEIDKGEFVFLTGPSGSGKTSLLRMLLREITPDKGEIRVNGENITHLKKKQVPKYRQKIGVVFQDFKLINELTVYENIAVPLRVMGYKRDEIHKKVMSISKLVGLEHRLTVFPSQMAGGELQRAGLARAVISHPPLLLADEPTGNLDPVTSWQIMQLLQKISAMGTTIIMATHNSEIVEAMGKRIIHLEHGVIVNEQNKHDQAS